MTETSRAHPSPQARDLALRHLPILTDMVRQTSARVPPSVRVADLHAAGLVALYDAALDHDTSGDASFAEIAADRIRVALVDELRSTDWASRRRGGSTTGDELVRHAERLLHLTAALDDLPVAQRAVVRDYFFIGLADHEMAPGFEALRSEALRSLRGAVTAEPGRHL